MRRTPQAALALLFAIVVCAFAQSVQAGIFSGTVKSVSADGKKFTIQSLKSKKTKTFQLSTSSSVSLNNKPSELSKLQPGMKVSVFTAGSTDRVRKVIARTADSTPKPSGTKSTKPATTSRKSSSRTTAASNRTANSSETEWHQFRGPNRDNISAETGLLKSWPTDGPPLAWTARGLGSGYSSLSVAKGHIYTMGTEGQNEIVIALNEKDGSQLWSVTISQSVRQSSGNGPRSTPTVDGDNVYALGAGGDLFSLDANSGKVNWKMNILQQFEGSNITWGITESVLIDGDKLICSPGGKQATMVALNKNSGDVIWKAAAPGNPRAGYSSPIIATVGNVRQYITFTSNSVIGVNATSGNVMWGNTSSANGTANASAPVFAKNHVFSSSGYGTGGTLVQLSSTGNSTAAKQVYHTDDMKNHHGGMLILGDYLYGSNDPGILTCIDLTTGKVAWKNRSVGKGSITFADGHIYLRSERGPVALVEAKPGSYLEKGRFNQPNRSNASSWSHPVIANGKLYLRDQDLLLCYDVKAK